MIENATPDALPEDRLVRMRVSDLPFPNVWQSRARDVAKIRRSLRTSGWAPKPDDRPIMVYRRPGRPDVLPDGNHRTEALKTAGGMEDVEVDVLLTYRRPEWFPDYL